MSVDHHVELSDEDIQREAAARRAAIREHLQRAKVTVTVGAPVSLRSRMYYAGQTAHGVGAIVLAASWAAGASVAVCIPVAAVAGLAAGVLFHRAPRVWSRIVR